LLRAHYDTENITELSHKQGIDFDAVYDKMKIGPLAA
jgi:hypothetical protein